MNYFKIIPLLLFCLINACSEPKQTLELTFDIATQSEPVPCGRAISLANHNRTFLIKDLRFYLFDIALIDPNHQRVPLKLIEKNNPWQYKNIALIDLGSIQNQCNKSKAGNATITGEIISNKYRGLEFTLGVPFALNHNAPSFSESPLNLGSMFWSWQMGYKFLRLDLIDSNNQNWFFHLGSTACKSPSTVRAPTSCDKPNRITVRLDKPETGNHRILLNLDKLLENAKLIPSSKCMSIFDDDNDCEIIFSNFGLNTKTGQCTEKCLQQNIFAYEN